MTSEIINYCPQCRTEYRQGVVTCADCEVALVQRLDVEGADNLVALTRHHSFEFVAELLDMLEKNDVPYVVEAGTALQLLVGGSADFATPQPWEARIWVAGSREHMAHELLRELMEKLRDEHDKEKSARFMNDDRSR
jgi:hypothetical protein